ncbi:MAG: acyloxyacyl hydrolase [Hyphomicrobiaceae bacterium]|nr:acyloxyacyl hydrolase [Hyphomicrobiaceae bacterium]
MKLVSLAGVAAAAVIAAAGLSLPASAADLRGLKDGYAAPLPQVQHGAAGPCYFRADIGYSWSQDPDVKWPVNNVTRDPNPNFIAPPDPLFIDTTTFVTDKVANATAENTWFGEGGIGCSFGGSRGVRIEAVFGYHGDRKIDGEPGFFVFTDNFNGTPPVNNGGDPLHTSIRSYTLMLNAYKDFGNFGGFIPYVGAGVGAAYHQLDDVFFTGNPNLTNRIRGDNDLAFAWSLMAGVGYQISDKAILDLGYRYIDLGKISSQRSDSAGFVNPAVNVDDITAHEIKIGLRYHFGGDCCAAPVSQPLK